MVRRFLPRLPLLRVLIPRPSAPILPLTSRLRTLPGASSSLASNSRNFHNSAPRLASPPQSPTSPQDQSYPRLPPDATLSQRLRYLIKSYGWYALGVYLIVGALDFGVAFASIQLLGAEQVSKVATSAKDWVGGMLPSKPPAPGREEMEAPRTAPGGHEGIYAMVVLAWTIHKTLFLHVREGVTTAFTPRLVGWLRQRGWAGGAGTRRAATEMRERMRRKRGQD